MKTYELSDKDLLAWWASQKYWVIPGVLRITKGKPRFTAVISGGTHGDEILEGVGALREALRLEDDLVDCDLLVVLGNLEASLQYMETDDPELRKNLSNTPGGENLNRLPADLRTLDLNISEHARAFALRRVILPHEPRFWLDVHSTNQPSAPAALGIVGDVRDLCSRLPVEKLYWDVGPIQASRGTRSLPFSGAFGAANALEIEVGQLGDPHSQESAAEIVRDWLLAIGFLPGSVPAPRVQKSFRVVDSIMAGPELGQNVRVADPRFLKEHAPVKAGEVLLLGDNNTEVRSPFDGELLWCPDGEHLLPYERKKEVWFIIQPS